MLKTAPICLVFFILLWQPAAAQTLNNYFGIGIRSSTVDNSDVRFNDGGNFEGRGYQLTFGQDLNRNFA